MSGFWNNLSNFLFALLVAKNMQKQMTDLGIESQNGKTDLVRLNDKNLNNTNDIAQITDLDIQKLEIEKKKLEIEEEKILLERDKLLVTSLIEDFKARWQELLNFENENSRWQTLYVTALILVVSWILSNSGESSKYKSIADIFNGENSYLLLCLAFINAIYTLALAYKGYQIQEIAQYLYTRIGGNVSNKINYKFNSWERWRRDEKGKPVLIRSVYYSVISVLPTIVSGIILFLYYKLQFYETHVQRKWLNFVFIVVLIFVSVSFFTALYTTRMNLIWKKIFAEEDKAEEDKRNNKDAGD